MGNRIDELEESINNLKTEVLTDNTSTNLNPEESKPNHNWRRNVITPYILCNYAILKKFNHNI